MRTPFLFLFVLLFQLSFSQVNISVDMTQETHPISPYIYGKNNSLSDDASKPLSEANWQKLRDAGVQMLRENGGNNATKYNWKRKLSSHPDWYNNVYSHNWDFEALSLQDHLPYAQGMWGFQLLGKAAANTSHNFNDWDYNQAAWWSGVGQNLAGGGVINPAGGSEALQDGDPDQYLMEWTADSTVGILDHWFGNNGLGLDNSNFLYWNMDNEPEIWSGTHDDVMPAQLPAEEFMQKYFQVAKKARAAFPGIKLVGPVTANEWQWYNWNNNAISYSGSSYCWLEYFIKRVAEEQEATGIRLLDVIDLHFYPEEQDPEDIVQLHRIYFDKTYSYPGANGVKRVNGGWDASINKEYIFERCREWLNEYMGPDHGVTFGITETAVKTNDANVIAAWYASTIGTFAKEGVEIFTPWDWKTGMWETLHLFSRYSHEDYVPSTSDNETYVSCYPSVNNAKDSLTLILVNRSTSQTFTGNIRLNSFAANGSFTKLTLSDLPSGETFVSHTSNALKTGSVNVSGNTFQVSLEPLSVTAVILQGMVTSVKDYTDQLNISVFPNPVQTEARVTFTLKSASYVETQLIRVSGEMVYNGGNVFYYAGKNNITIPADFGKGIYVLRLITNEGIVNEKLIVQ